MFLSDASLGVYGRCWGWTRGRCPLHHRVLTFRSPCLLQWCSSSWRTSGARKEGDKAWLAPNPGLFLKCCQDRTIKDEAPGCCLCSPLLAGVSHHDRQPRKAPTMSQPTLPSATPSGLPCWATLTPLVAGRMHPMGWEGPPEFWPRQ